MPEDRRYVAFDSNVLTYFLDGNRGNYRLAPDDPLADQRIAAVRLFLYCAPFIVPTVRDESSSILDPIKLDEHMSFIDTNFGEFIPDDDQEESIGRRTSQLLPHHPRGPNDCRIVAEVEEDGGLPVLVTFDDRLETGSWSTHPSPYRVAGRLLVELQDSTRHAPDMDTCIAPSARERAMVALGVRAACKGGSLRRVTSPQGGLRSRRRRCPL